MTAPQTVLVPNRRLRGGFPGFAIATLALTGLSGWAMTLGFRGPGDAPAILTSGIVALVIQLGAFRVIRLLTVRSLIAGVGAGALIRFTTLVAYGILASKVLFLPPAAALISLFVFYFLSMVIEPLFLRS